MYNYFKDRLRQPKSIISMMFENDLIEIRSFYHLSTKIIDFGATTKSIKLSIVLWIYLVHFLFQQIAVIMMVARVSLLHQPRVFCSNQQQV